MSSVSIVNIEDTAPILKKSEEQVKQARVGDAEKKPGNPVLTIACSF